MNAGDGATAPQPLTNDALDLTPQTDFAGPALAFDFPALLVGVAEHVEGPTGCTVFLFPAGARVAMDVQGGSPGYIGDYGFLHAICLAGGSLLGLEAATGVQAELFAQNGYATAWGSWALVSGAIVFDWGGRGNAIYPDKLLGRAAVRAARPGWFSLGRRGAGAHVTVGNGPRFDQGERSGQGGAFHQYGPTKIAAFTVVNAIGAVMDRDGRVVRGHRDRVSGERYTAAVNVQRLLSSGEGPAPSGGNTTLTVVVTNQAFERDALQQIGRQVHSAMARAIRPFYTTLDGDILYMVTTGEIENPLLDGASFGTLASELVRDAVLAAVS